MKKAFCHFKSLNVDCIFISAVNSLLAAAVPETDLISWIPEKKSQTHFENLKYFEIFNQQQWSLFSSPARLLMKLRNWSWCSVFLLWIVNWLFEKVKRISKFTACKIGASFCLASHLLQLWNWKQNHPPAIWALTVSTPLPFVDVALLYIWSVGCVVFGKLNFNLQRLGF